MQTFWVAMATSSLASIHAWCCCKEECNSYNEWDDVPYGSVPKTTIIRDKCLYCMLNFPRTYIHCDSFIYKVRSGVTQYGKERIQNAIQKRRLRKERAHKPPSPGQQLHPCPHCSRLFKAPTGLRSHLRTHNAWSHAHLHSWMRRIIYSHIIIWYVKRMKPCET